ncbi:MAG: HAMP domain-containing sensor histidine kinase [Terricaulis sp.]
MQRLTRFLNPKSALQRLVLHTCGIVAALAAVAVLADYVVNVVLLHAVDQYTPWSTLIIVLVTAPPSTFFLLLQTEKVRNAKSLLATEQAARAAAEAVNAARTRFLANTSHELRTPLSGIIGYSELMLESAEADKRVQDAADLSRIITSARRLEHLVNNLLDLAKLDADRIDVTPASFDVREMLVSSIESASPMAAANRNIIKLEIGNDVARANSDAARLSQCVLNLLSNAAKFTSDGVITVRASRIRRVDGDRLTIAVEDTGIGVAPERAPVLFEPFMQTHTSGEAAAQGAGLGLALTRKLARLLGGDVSYEDIAQAGSRFTLNVPLNLDTGEAPVAANAAAEDLSPAQALAGVFSRR